MFFLVPAHPGCPGQNPLSRKTVVVVVVVVIVFCTDIRKTAYKESHAHSLRNLMLDHWVICAVSVIALGFFQLFDTVG